MFTETELREALEHSAERADTLADDLRPARRRRRVWLPIAAAASVAALAVGGAVLLGGGSRTHRAAVSPPPTSTPTPTRVSTTATAPADPHVPVDLANAVDLIQVTHDYHSYLTIGGNGDAQVGTETFEQFLGGMRTLDVTVVDSKAFDPARFPRDHPVAIAGTTGYYARFKLFPLDADTGPGSDKYTAPWTVGFVSPSGKWVFVSIENGVDFTGVKDPHTLVSAYESRAVRFVAGASRLAFRTGYLPQGFALDNIVLGYGESMTLLTKGGRSIEIDVLHDRAANECVSVCGATKKVGRYTVNVYATGYDPAPKPGRVSIRLGVKGQQTTPPTPVADALERRILAGLQLAPDLADTSTYWTVTDALG